MAFMSDTGEQGMTPQDPAHRGGIGGGLIPDDLGEGCAQAEELAEHPPSAEAAKDLDPPSPSGGSEAGAEPPGSG